MTRRLPLVLSLLVSVALLALLAWGTATAPRSSAQEPAGAGAGPDAGSAPVSIQAFVGGRLIDGFGARCFSISPERCVRVPAPAEPYESLPGFALA